MARVCTRAPGCGPRGHLLRPLRPECGGRRAQSLEPWQRIEIQQPVEDGERNHRAAGMPMSVGQHHDAETAVRQHADLAGVAAPGPAMDDLALAAIARDFESEAAMHVANFGKAGAPDMDLWCRELSRGV